MAVMPARADEPVQVKLIFSESVVVNDTQFLLNNIAEIQVENSSVRQQLEQIVMGASAPPSFCRFIDRDEAVRRISIGCPNVKIAGYGPARIKITTDHQVIEQHKISTAVQMYLDTMLGWKEEYWSCETDSISLDMKIFRQDFDIEITGLEENRFPKGETRIDVAIRQPSGKCRARIVCNIHVILPVYIAHGTIERGTIITKEHYRMQTMDVTRYAPEPYTEDKCISGKKALRTITSGTILNNRMFAEIPIIEKGDPVSILYKSSTMSVAITGTAREPGLLGDKIWVENGTTGKLVRVIILGQGKVALCKGVS